MHSVMIRWMIVGFFLNYKLASKMKMRRQKCKVMQADLFTAKLSVDHDELFADNLSQAEQTISL